MLLRKLKLIIFTIFFYIFFNVEAYAWIFNNPYPASESTKNIFYNSFTEQPKTLDPAKAYSSNELQFIEQIYEPLLDYDYLKRPYTLVPLMATELPEIHYYDKDQNEVKDIESSNIATSVYTIRIKKGVLYQPHPAFARDEQGNYRYYQMKDDFFIKSNINTLSDFKYTSTRELIVDDYIYEIKRLANPLVNSPIYGLMGEYILGFKEFGASLPSLSKADVYVDLRKYPMAGLKKIDDYQFQITIKGIYPQFLYWMAMSFFTPIPWEADRFYKEPYMQKKNLDFGWYPVGTGPFLLAENNPNSRMVLAKNPNFRLDYYPTTGTPSDFKNGYLKNAGLRLPLIEKAVYTLEKESIPRWNKFLQGYYDVSGITSDSFDKAIQISTSGFANLTEDMQEKGIRLIQQAEPSIFYLGFNMLDSVVGGDSERARKLRQAISIVINYDENISIFLNGRGKAAQGPIPPGVFGYKSGEAGINPYIYTWEKGLAKRRTIEEARRLMTEAGYPNGHDKDTGEALILHYDVHVTGGPDDKAQLNWMQKQFAFLGISLDVRATQYNRFQEKIRSGNAQIFTWAWLADYPDPENFLFLFYGPNGKVKFGGENAVNYSNKVYDKLFVQMKNRANDLKRTELIDKMVELLRHDAPWAWGISSESLILSQRWVSPNKPNSMSRNTLKYMAIDVSLRNKLRSSWNTPVLWPLVLFILLIALLLLPFIFAYRKKARSPVRRTKL